MASCRTADKKGTDAGLSTGPPPRSDCRPGVVHAATHAAARRRWRSATQLGAGSRGAHTKSGRTDRVHRGVAAGVVGAAAPEQLVARSDVGGGAYSHLYNWTIQVIF